MAEPQLGFADYLKAAFHHRVRLPLLGNMPLNKFALMGFGILGVGHPGFWLLGLGIEVGYLMWLTGNERFQKFVRGEKLLARLETWEEHEKRMLAQIDKPSRDRYYNLVERCAAILRSHEIEGIGGMGLDELNQVRPVYLRLLSVRQRIQQMLQATRREELERDVESLKNRLADTQPDMAVARALEGTLKIQQSRLENLDRSVMSLYYTNTELERIEKQISLIAEEVAVSRNPERWSQSVDNIMHTIQGTTQWMADHSELLSDAPLPAVGAARTAQKN